MLEGDSPLRSRVVRFLMECDEAVAMRKDGHLNPLFAHSTVRGVDRPTGRGLFTGRPIDWVVALPIDRLLYRSTTIALPADRPTMLPTDP